MKIDIEKLKGSELIEELNKLIGKSINLSFGSFGGIILDGTLEETEKKVDRICSYKLNGANINIFDEGDYELRLDDTYVGIGLSYFVFIKEV